MYFPPWCGLLLAWCLAWPLSAQTSLKDLKAQAASGQAAAVMLRIEQLAAKGKVDLPRLSLGARLATEAQDLRHAFHFQGLMARLFPRQPLTWTWFGRLTLSQAQASHALKGATLVDAAKGGFRRARQLGGDGFENGYPEARAWFQAGYSVEALQAINAALQSRPRDRRAQVFKVKLLLKLQRMREAALLALQLWKNHPQDQELALLRLRAALEGEDLQACRSVFLELVKALPEDVALYDSFYLAFENPDLPERPAFCAKVLGEVRRAQPRAALPLFYLASVAAVQTRYKESLKLYKAYCARRPQSGVAHYWVAALQIYLGQLDLGERSLQEARSLGDVGAGSLARLYRRLVAAHVKRKAYGRALPLQQAVVTLSNQVSDVLDLAVLQLGDGRGEDALRTYRGLLQREDLDYKEESQTENYLALALWGMGKRQAALKAFKRSLGAFEDDLDARENLGVLLLELGRKKEALTELKTAIAARPPRDRDRARYHLLRLEYPLLVENP